jgi:glycosyltransferase involved in cell wall biosynthesis
VTGAAAVDVLLPVRDGASTLEQTLASIRAQTLPDFRCLVLDDGSRDGSADLAERVAREDRRFEVHRLAPRGIVATLNDGLALATAERLARIDADDVMLPERLARQVAFLDGNPDIQVVASRVEFFGGMISVNLRAYERWLNALLTPVAIARELFVESPIPHPSVTMRTSALRAVGGYRDLPFPEDYDLWLRGLRAGWNFGKLDEVLTRLRDHPRRLTWTDSRYAARAFLECKAEHLVALRSLEGREVVVWGAGRDGKRMAKALRRRGALLRHLVDIAPTKLGRSMLGVRVLPPESLAAAPRAFVVAAVGIKGARAEIRSALEAMDYCEGEDFVCVG